MLETTAGGGTLRAYVWGEAAPLAQLDGGGLLYLHTDALGTPRLATDTTQTVRWRWEGEAFGATPPNEDPDQDQVLTTIDLRFPGQYYDAESGLSYNWNRYYDPRVGRYVTSDPIGIEGGLNTYAYVENNPLRFIDPWGLRDMTQQEVTRLLDVARDWGGSNVPYAFGGKTKQGADCSGAVWGIFNQTGFHYEYLNTAYFSSSPRFRPIPPGSEPKAGDVGVYPDLGHMVLRDPGAGQNRDVWSAFRRGGPPFGAASSTWFEGRVQWYRYDVPEDCSCSGK